MNDQVTQQILDRLDAIERRLAMQNRLGSHPPSDEGLQANAKSLADRLNGAKDKLVKLSAEPVDRSKRILASGDPVPEDESHREIDTTTGQQKGYVVLSADERAKGFVRPYRDVYRHLKCGRITTMGRSIAETYARDPGFYSGTFCVTCGGHYPVGEQGEFVWYEMDGSTGPKVGS